MVDLRDGFVSRTVDEAVVYPVWCRRGLDLYEKRAVVAACWSNL